MILMHALSPNVTPPLAIANDAMDPPSRSTIQTDSIQIPPELVEDLLCVTLAVWRQQQRAARARYDPSLAHTLVPVIRPSRPLLQMVARDISCSAVARTHGASGNLDHIQSIFKYGGLQFTEEDSRQECAELVLVEAALNGHVHILDWWFSTAETGSTSTSPRLGAHLSKAGMRVGSPAMPRLAQLLYSISESVEPDTEDAALRSLGWLADHGYLPDWGMFDEELQIPDSYDWDGLELMFFNASGSGCTGVGCFLLETYGPTYNIAANEPDLVAEVARVGSVAVLADLVTDYPEDCGTLDSFAEILVGGATGGKLEVLQWWSDYLCDDFDISDFVLDDPAIVEFLADYDPVCADVAVAQVLQDKCDAVSRAKIAASAGRHVHVLDWFRRTGLMDCAREELQKFRADIARDPASHGLPEVVDWWLKGGAERQGMARKA